MGTAAQPCATTEVRAPVSPTDPTDHTANADRPEAPHADGTLFVVGTPIGNLGDLSPRAREVLGRVASIAAEDTRRTRRLLSSIGLEKPLIAFHEHNESVRADELLHHLESGESIALVSDAGMPLISDPGWKLVAEALDRGIAVRVVPGPCAVTGALAVSGLPTDRFVFEGFLPRRAAARETRLRALATEPRTLVFFESVHRVGETVAALAAVFGSERRAAVVRELTKVHEQVVNAPLGVLASQLGSAIPTLGEFVIVVEGAEEAGSVDFAEVRRVFELLRKELPPGRAAKLTAELTGAPRNAVYALINENG